MVTYAYVLTCPIGEPLIEAIVEIESCARGSEVECVALVVDCHRVGQSIAFAINYLGSRNQDLKGKETISP